MLMAITALPSARSWLMILGLGLCISVGAGGHAALATAACAPRDDLVRWLADRHGETPIAAGQGDNGQLVEVFASPQRTTWSIIATLPDGTSCFVVTGQSWGEPGRPGMAVLGRS